MPSLQTWISLSDEQEAKQVLLCQSTSRVGAEEGGREGGSGRGERGGGEEMGECRGEWEAREDGGELCTNMD